MFCPNSADWGNVADWISGAGSLAAVVTALYIADAQNRLANRQRDQLEKARRQTRRDLICEIMRLTAEIEKEARRGSNDFGSENQGLIISVEINALARQLDSLKELAKDDPQLYGEVSRIVREAGIPPNEKLHNQLAGRYGVIVRSMIARRKILEAFLAD